MTPVRCISHLTGEFGDCYRACLASILDMPAEAVPNFGHLARHDSEEMTRLARGWLAERGLGIFQTWVSGEWPLEKVLRLFSRDNPGVPFILHGEARLRGAGDINHAVVALNGAIAHDPSGAGIAGPSIASDNTSEPWWWVDIVAFADRSTLQSTTLERKA